MRHGSERSDRAPIYRYRPEVYDLVHADKPYREEAEAVRALVRKSAARPARTLLDVACGSGRHLEKFVRWFDCTGLDASPEMLALARRRLPRIPLVVGRMESFDLGREFDVVTCLFSAIGYARSVQGLSRTVRNLARHVAPGGVLVVEPWLTPKVFREGWLHHLVVEREGTVVIRMNGSRLRRGRSVFDFHYLVGRDGEVDHFVERHDLGLFDVPTMLGAFRGAGLSVRYLARGLSTRRGLYVGRRTPRRSAGRGRDGVRPRSR